jgi:hypothetical protein
MNNVDEILLPLNEYATEPEAKNKCVWINEKGGRPGETCDGSCCLSSDEYCSAHYNLAKKRGLLRETQRYQAPVNSPCISETKTLTPLEEAFPRVHAHSYIQIPQDLSPQEIQHNVEQLKRLDLLNNMMDLLKISFK